ncbi:hypothetical protein KY285_001008 [Solanum tuberosum]|nr:hypothetical protein KY285_001008 [Solanum tuberosum]
MDDEINSRFQEEHVITETLMDSKLAAMERLGERVVQAIQEQFFSLGIGSTKLIVHGPESSGAPTTSRSTNSAPRGNTRHIQPADQNHQISGNSIRQYQDPEKVGFTWFHLLGEAQLWYYQLKRAKGPTSWDDFQKRCFQRFGHPESSNPMGELVTLRQIGTVEIYQRQFQEKFARADEFIPEHLQVGIFMAGLDDSIKLDVQLLKQPDLPMALSIARDLEEKTTTAKSQYHSQRGMTTVSEESWQQSELSKV